MNKLAKGNSEAKIAESKALTQSIIAEGKAKLAEAQARQALAKAKAEKKMQTAAQRAKAQKSFSSSSSSESQRLNEALNLEADDPSHPEGNSPKRIKKKFGAQENEEEDFDVVDTTTSGEMAKSPKGRALGLVRRFPLPKSSPGPKGPNPFLHQYDEEGEEVQTDSPNQRKRGYHGMMPAVITTAIKPMSDLGPKLKAQDWRSFQVECNRMTANMPAVQARAIRNSSIPETNWMNVELLLVLKQDYMEEGLRISLEQLKEYDHDMFFEVVLSLFLEEQGQAAPDLSEKLKKMNLSYMASFRKTVARSPTTL